MINYLEKLKEKCNVNNEFIDVVDELFEKLIYFGYITSSEKKKLQKKLFDNINTVLIGNDISLDYKSGYYDSIKKELYIRDLSNLESVYLRILYILSTNEISDGVYNVGYSSAAISKNSYKIMHKNYGLNRAITSNLVCRLLHTTPTTLSILPTYRTYENDFIGNKLSSDNDIYFLEGKILKQICFTFNISEENLYLNLFSKSPIKFLDILFKKIPSNTVEYIFELFDNISKEYSNYNKLCYLNLLLDKNYIEIKKNILNKDTNELEKENTKIKRAIKSALLKLIPENIEENSDELNIDSSLSEKINELEESILNNINLLQNALVDYLVENELSYSIMDYSIKLKELEKMLIKKNDKLTDTIFNVISRKLLNASENTASNLTQKIKYSLINEILSSDKYIKIYKSLSFKQINLDDNNDNYSLIAITIDNSFIQLVEVSNLNNSMKLINSNTKLIQIDNMKYLLDNPSRNSDVHKIERIYTEIKNKYPKFSNLGIDNFYRFDLNDSELVLAVEKDNFSILSIVNKNNDIHSKLLKLSERYSIFDFNNSSNLPVLYKKKENFLTKVLSVFSLVFS